MKKWIIAMVFVGLLGPSLALAEDSVTRKQLESRLQDLQGLLPQIEQAYITTQGRIAEIRNLIEDMDKVKDMGSEKKEDKK